MSMSSSVRGFVPPDDKFKKMLKAYKSCEDAGISPPKEVRDFFNDETPDPAGVEINLKDKKYKDAVKVYHAEMQEGFEIDLTKLPDDIKVIRFVNSY